MAASLPAAPIDTPTSASAKTGASFIPSPTYSTLPLALYLEANSLNFSAFSSGNKSW